MVESPLGTMGFQMQHLGWIVEQSNACLGRGRRLAKDYEYVPSSSDARILIASIDHSLRPRDQVEARYAAPLSRAIPLQVPLRVNDSALNTVKQLSWH